MLIEVRVLLRRLHDASPGTGLIRDATDTAARAGDQLRRSGALICAAQAQLIRAHAARLGQIAPLLPAAPTHGDAQPRNFLWDPSARRLALIDFERAETGPAVGDLVRLEYGPWDGRPGLRASFLAGYGRSLTAAEEAALPGLAALDALSGLLWGTAASDQDVVARARRTLARLSAASPP